MFKVASSNTSEIPSVIDFYPTKNQKNVSLTSSVSLKLHPEARLKSSEKVLTVEFNNQSLNGFTYYDSQSGTLSWYPTETVLPQNSTISCKVEKNAFENISKDLQWTFDTIGLTSVPVVLTFDGSLKQTKTIEKTSPSFAQYIELISHQFGASSNEVDSFQITISTRKHFPEQKFELKRDSPQPFSELTHIAANWLSIKPTDIQHFLTRSENVLIKDNSDVSYLDGSEILIVCLKD